MHYPLTLRIAEASSIVVNQAAAATLAILGQPSRACYLKMKVSGGTANSGTITPTGSLAGVGKTETQTWTATDTKRSSEKYDALTSIVTSGLADETTKPTVLIEAVDGTGAPVDVTRTAQDYPCAYHMDDRAMQQLQVLGKSAAEIFRVKAEGKVTGLYLGQEISIISSESTDTLLVNSKPRYRAAQGTDLIVQTEFYAVRKGGGL